MYFVHDHLTRPLSKLRATLKRSCIVSGSILSSSGCVQAHPIESPGNNTPGVYLAKGKEAEIPHVAILFANWPAYTAETVTVCLCNKITD